MRIQELDFLRGVAILMVLMHHFTFIFPFMPYGWIGVDLFFVLSGFLVSGLLFREYKQYGAIRPVRFLVRRGLKIYPAYYFFTLTAIGLTVLTESMDWNIWNMPLSRPVILSESFFLQNYVDTMWIHTWSLAVEEHFYLALALLFPWLAHRDRIGSQQTFGMLYGSLALLCLGLRIWNHLTHNYTEMTHNYPTHLRIDGLFFGVWLSHVYHFRKEAFLNFFFRFRISLTFGALILIVAAQWFPKQHFFSNTFGLTMNYLSFGTILGLMITHKDGVRMNIMMRFPLIRLISYIGLYSYSIYLWHILIRRYTLAFFTKFGPFEVYDNWKGYLIYLLASVMGGVILARVVEYPFLKWRDRKFPSRSNSLL